MIISNPRNHAAAGLGLSEASGVFSYWPGTLGLGATQDPALIRDFAQTAAKEWRATGIRKRYMYQVEAATEPRWTRNNGTFGEDPDLLAKIARELVLGFQGEKLGPDSIALTMKHYPGNGIAPRGVDSHDEPGKFAVYPTAGSLIKYQLLIQYALEAMGFKGYLNTDSQVAVDGNQVWGVENLTVSQRVAKSMNAGVSLLSIASSNLATATPTLAPTELIKAINAGLTTEATLNKAAVNLLKEMFALGIFENPYVDPANAEKVVHSAEAQAKADVAQRKSVVLLKNNDALPLAKTSPATVKIYGEVFAKTGAADLTTALRAKLATQYPTATIVSDFNLATHAILIVQPCSLSDLAQRGGPQGCKSPPGDFGSAFVVFEAPKLLEL